MQLAMPEAVLGTLAHTLMDTSTALDGRDMVCMCAHVGADDELLNTGRARRKKSVAEGVKSAPIKFYLVFYDSRRGRRGSVSTPKVRKTSFRLWPSRFRKAAQPLSNLLNYTRVQMAQVDGVQWAYELLFVACAQEAVATKKNQRGFSDVQH